MDKAIVYIEDRNEGNYKHSAWDTKKEAEHQAKVLRDHGYKGVYVEQVDHNYINGHYFV